MSHLLPWVDPFKYWINFWLLASFQLTYKGQFVTTNMKAIEGQRKVNTIQHLSSTSFHLIFCMYFVIACKQALTPVHNQPTHPPLFIQQIPFPTPCKSPPHLIVGHPSEHFFTEYYVINVLACFQVFHLF